MTSEAFMRRALDLAELGKEWVSPNPMVGCVIVHNGKIIGEGYHQKYGESHAEVNAVESVADKSLLSESTIYVTLEPCAHTGKTPPCALLLVKHKVKKVVICNKDPFPEVNGKGIEILKKAGIRVETGLLEEEGEQLNKVFFTSIRHKRPYIILKWAETADGFVAKLGGKPIAISNEVSQIVNHKWRSELDAIMVGSNTALNDNPSLTARAWKGKSPLRILIDRKLKCDQSLAIFDSNASTIVFNEVKHKTPLFYQLEFDKKWVQKTLDILNEKGVRSLIVEGGPRLHSAFIKANLYDEIRIIKSKLVVNEGIEAAKVPVGIELTSSRKFLQDEIFVFSR